MGLIRRLQRRSTYRLEIDRDSLVFAIKLGKENGDNEKDIEKLEYELGIIRTILRRRKETNNE